MSTAEWQDWSNAGKTVYIKFDASYEPEVIDIMRRVLKPGDCAIDGGANIGFFTTLMGVMVGEEGMILAFEPAADNVKKLCENIALRNTPAKVISQPLWDKCEKVTLHLGPGEGCHSLRPLMYKTDETIDKQVMEATTIDTWNVAPRLIKLDIEGSEVNALMGAVETISKHHPYIISEWNSNALSWFGRAGGDISSFVREKFGYATFVLEEKGVYPIYLPEGVDVTSPYPRGANLLLATIDMVAKAFPVMKLHQ
jgi:FkbM family methyltransferase